MEYYRNLILIALYLLLVKSADPEWSNFYRNMFMTTKRPIFSFDSRDRDFVFNTLNSNQRLHLFIQSENPFEQSMKIQDSLRSSCTPNIQRSCGKSWHHWCCLSHQECDTYGGCTESTLPSRSSNSSFTIFIIIFILIAICMLKCCCQHNLRSNNSSTTNDCALESQERLTQSVFLPIHSLSSQRDTENPYMQQLGTSWLVRDLLQGNFAVSIELDNHEATQITGTFIEELNVIPPPAYDEISGRGSVMVEQQTLLPPTYNDYIQSNSTRAGD